MGKSLLTKQERLELMQYTYARYNALKHKTPMSLELSRLRQEANDQLRQKVREEWYKNNGKGIDAKKIKHKWREVATKCRDDFLNVALDSLACVEGVSKANDGLNYNLDLKNAAIDINQVSKVADKLFNIGILVKMLSNYNFEDWIKQDIIKRYTSSLFPYKDNTDAKNAIASQILDNYLEKDNG